MFYDSTGSTASTSSCSSRRTPWHINNTRSIILSPLSLTSSLKILPISRLSTRGIVFSSLICYPLLLMPPSIAFIRRAVLVALILLVSKVIPSCSYYIKKGLICVIITAPSSHQPSSYTKCIKANMRLSYNIYSISNAKYKRLTTLYNLLVPCLIYCRVLNLVCR